MAWAERFQIAGGMLPGVGDGNAGDTEIAIKMSEGKSCKRHITISGNPKQNSCRSFICTVVCVCVCMCVLFKRKKLRAILLFYQIKLPLYVQNIYASVLFFIRALSYCNQFQIQNYFYR